MRSTYSFLRTLRADEAIFLIVLELGAGSALLSLLAARMKASQVAITDYPSTGILDAIRKNVECNLDEEERSRVSVNALDWTDELALRDMSERYPEGFTRCVYLSLSR